MLLLPLAAAVADDDGAIQAVTVAWSVSGRLAQQACAERGRGGRCGKLLVPPRALTASLLWMKLVEDGSCAAAAVAWHHYHCAARG